MPNLPESRVTLEDLIKLKRHEEPDSAFWDRFDRDFEHRRLRALINDDESEEASAGAGWLRQVGWTFGALAAALAISFVGLTRHAPLSDVLAGESPQAPLSAGASLVNTPVLEHHAEGESFRSVFSTAESAAETVMVRSVPEARFIIDAIPSHSEPTHFQRVLANPAFIQARQSGAEFVADTLTTSGRPRATFLVDRPRGQF